MKSAIIVFPGTNRERDMARALKQVTGSDPVMVWHTRENLPDVDLLVLPGGFSYGDYLRCGAIAARAPVMHALREKARHGTRILGVCNGFQLLTETGLLPGALLRNASLKFVCRDVKLEIVNNQTGFTSRYPRGAIIRCPVAHHDGNYFADTETLSRLEGEGRVLFRYTPDTNPNGALNDIAGICNAQGNVLGMMPHPENAVEPLQGNMDGKGLFESMMEACT